MIERIVSVLQVLEVVPFCPVTKGFSSGRLAGNVRKTLGAFASTQADLANLKYSPEMS